MDSVAVEPGVPANADPAADSSANANNNAIALQERQQHTDNNEEGSSDSFPWWKDLAHKALEYSEDDLRPWSTVDQFRKYCAHGHHRKEIDEYTYTGSCCVELIYNILQYSSTKQLVFYPAPRLSGALYVKQRVRFGRCEPHQPWQNTNCLAKSGSCC